MLRGSWLHLQTTKDMRYILYILHIISFLHVNLSPQVYLAFNSEAPQSWQVDPIRPSKQLLTTTMIPVPAQHSTTAYNCTMHNQGQGSHFTAPEPAICRWNQFLLWLQVPWSFKIGRRCSERSVAVNYCKLLRKHTQTICNMRNMSEYVAVTVLQHREKHHEASFVGCRGCCLRLFWVILIVRDSSISTKSDVKTQAQCQDVPDNPQHKKTSAYFDDNPVFVWWCIKWV